jgi:hypothetical protein
MPAATRSIMSPYASVESPMMSRAAPDAVPRYEGCVRGRSVTCWRAPAFAAWVTQRSDAPQSHGSLTAHQFCRKQPALPLSSKGLKIGGVCLIAACRVRSPQPMPDCPRWSSVRLLMRIKGPYCICERAQPVAPAGGAASTDRASPI